MTFVRKICAFNVDEIDNKPDPMLKFFCLFVIRLKWTEKKWTKRERQTGNHADKDIWRKTNENREPF